MHSNSSKYGFKASHVGWELTVLSMNDLDCPAITTALFLSLYLASVPTGEASGLCSDL